MDPSSQFDDCACPKLHTDFLPSFWGLTAGQYYSVAAIVRRWPLDLLTEFVNAVRQGDFVKSELISGKDGFCALPTGLEHLIKTFDNRSVNIYLAIQDFAVKNQNSHFYCRMHTVNQIAAKYFCEAFEDVLSIYAGVNPGMPSRACRLRHKPVYELEEKIKELELKNRAVENMNRVDSELTAHVKSLEAQIAAITSAKDSEVESLNSTIKEMRSLNMDLLIRVKNYEKMDIIKKEVDKTLPLSEDATTQTEFILEDVETQTESILSSIDTQTDNAISVDNIETQTVLVTKDAGTQIGDNTEVQTTLVEYGTQTDHQITISEIHDIISRIETPTVLLNESAAQTDHNDFGMQTEVEHPDDEPPEIIRDVTSNLAYASTHEVDDILENIPNPRAYLEVLRPDIIGLVDEYLEENLARISQKIDPIDIDCKFRDARKTVTVPEMPLRNTRVPIDVKDDNLSLYAISERIRMVVLCSTHVKNDLLDRSIMTDDRFFHMQQTLITDDFQTFQHYLSLKNVVKIAVVPVRNLHLSRSDVIQIRYNDDCVDLLRHYIASHNEILMDQIYTDNVDQWTTLILPDDEARNKSTQTDQECGHVSPLRSEMISFSHYYIQDDSPVYLHPAFCQRVFCPEC